MANEKQAIESVFDRKLAVRAAHMSEKRKQAFIDTNDDLEMCVAMSQSLFGRVQPSEVVIALYDRVQEKLLKP